jgi:hypothetical protein
MSYPIRNFHQEDYATFNRLITFLMVQTEGQVSVRDIVADLVRNFEPTMRIPGITIPRREEITMKRPPGMSIVDRIRRGERRELER